MIPSTHFGREILRKGNDGQEREVRLRFNYGSSDDECALCRIIVNYVLAISDLMNQMHV